MTDSDEPTATGSHRSAQAGAEGPASGQLICRTTELADSPELDLRMAAGADGFLFSRDNHGLAGRGVALRVPWANAATTLAALTPEGRGAPGQGGGPTGGAAGRGAAAFSARPFLPDASTDLVVPEVVVGRDAGGGQWVSTVLPAGSVEADRCHERAVAAVLDPVRQPPPTGPGHFDVRSARPPAAWTEAVATAVERIASGALDKVVLAREITVTADAPIPVATVLARLAASYPGCYLYSVDGYCGASPELLVARCGEIVRAQPMAGTLPRSGDPDIDARRTAELLASPTYRHEHQVTIDAVHDALLAFSSYVDFEPEPSVVALANVSHLATSVEGRLSTPAASVLELVDALHPTPAVCGRPRAAALALIAELEQLDRGRYAGAVGWVDAAGNGEWAVAIRGAMIEDKVARVIAGNGIVADADPQTELTETRAKLQAMLSAIVRP